MNERERLEKLVHAAVDKAVRSERHFVQCIVDALEKDRQEPPAPAPSPVWPGLEGEGLNRLSEVWITSSREAKARGLSYNDVRRAGYTAQAAHLWRAMVASMPTHTTEGSERVRVGYDFAYRTALAALADPYDGGGK